MGTWSIPNLDISGVECFMEYTHTESCRVGPITEFFDGISMECSDIPLQFHCDNCDPRDPLQLIAVAALDGPPQVPHDIQEPLESPGKSKSDGARVDKPGTPTSDDMFGPSLILEDDAIAEIDRIERNACQATSGKQKLRAEDRQEERRRLRTDLSMLPIASDSLAPKIMGEGSSPGMLSSLSTSSPTSSAYNINTIMTPTQPNTSPTTPNIPGRRGFQRPNLNLHPRA